MTRTGTRADEIHRGIVTAILEHRLKPGTKLGEDEIGTIYGVSRTIARAALQALAHDGIVVIEKNRGAFVARPTLTEAREVFEARKLLEPAIAARAAERFTPDRAQALDAHLTQEAAALAAGDDQAAIRLSGEFHMLIAEIADHRIYRNFLHELVARSSLIILIYRRRSAPACGANHHRQIARAIASGDAERAGQLMVEHLIEIEADLDRVEPVEATTSLAQVLRGL